MRNIRELLLRWLGSVTLEQFTNGQARHALEQMSGGGPFMEGERAALSAELDVAVGAGWLRRVRAEGAKRSSTYQVVTRPVPAAQASVHTSSVGRETPAEVHRYTAAEKREALAACLVFLYVRIQGDNVQHGYTRRERCVSLSALLQEAHNLPAGTGIPFSRIPMIKSDVHFQLLNARQWGLFQYDGAVIRWTRATEKFLDLVLGKDALKGLLHSRFPREWDVLLRLAQDITREADGDRRSGRRQ